MADSPRKNLRVFGPHGKSVRVFVERGGTAVRVQWRERGTLLKKSWPNTAANRADAIAYAKGVADAQHETVTPARERLTVRDLWERFTLAEFAHLRDKTIINYKGHWRAWEHFAGRSMMADTVTAIMLGEYRAALAKGGSAISQQRQAVSMVKQVFRWALRHELLDRDRVSTYTFKVAKEARTAGGAEYTTDDYVGIVGALDPRKQSQWRAWSLIVLMGELGPRVNAALHLRWDDVEFGAVGHGTVHWSPEFDKVGHERTQPITAVAREALLVALGWARLDERRSGWVFYAARGDRAARKGGGEHGAPYSVQSFIWMLREAEKRAKVSHIKYRGAHGFRRMVMGNALEVTGNVVDAMYFIGDTDLRQARKYAKERDHRMRGVAEKLTDRATRLEKHTDVTAPEPSKVPDTQNAEPDASALSLSQPTTYEDAE